MPERKFVFCPDLSSRDGYGLGKLICSAGPSGFHRALSVRC